MNNPDSTRTRRDVKEENEIETATAIIEYTLDQYNSRRKKKRNDDDFKVEYRYLRGISEISYDQNGKPIYDVIEPDEMDLIIWRQLQIDEEKEQFLAEIGKNENKYEKEELKKKLDEFEERYAAERAKIEEIEMRSLIDNTQGWLHSQDQIKVTPSIAGSKNKTLPWNQESDDDDDDDGQLPSSKDTSISEDDVYTNTFVSKKSLAPYEKVFELAKRGDSDGFFKYVSEELTPCRPEPEHDKACWQMRKKGGICLCSSFPWPTEYSGYNDIYHIQKSANPLHFAAAMNQAQFFENLLKYKTKVPEDIWPHFESMIARWLLHKDLCKMMPHFVAAFHGHEETLRQIIMCIAYFNPNYASGDLYPTLAVISEIESGPFNKVPETLIEFAIMNESKSMVDLVFKMNLFQMNHTAGALSEAASRGGDMVGYVYDRIAEYAEKQVQTGQLTLRPNVLEELEKTHEMPVKCYNGFFRKTDEGTMRMSNALHVAAEKGDLLSMQCLLNHIQKDSMNKTLLYATDHNLMSATTTAIACGHPQIVSLLNMMDDSTLYKNSTQNLLAALVTQSRHEPTLDLLIEHYVKTIGRWKRDHYLDFASHAEIFLPLKIAIALKEWIIYDKLLKLYIEWGIEPDSNIDHDLRESFRLLKCFYLKPSIHSIIKESLTHAGANRRNMPETRTFLPVSHRINPLRPRPEVREEEEPRPEVREEEEPRPEVKEEEE